jgi:hypothetical protein
VALGLRALVGQFQPFDSTTQIVGNVRTNTGIGAAANRPSFCGKDHKYDLRRAAVQNHGARQILSALAYLIGRRSMTS